ncbi:hypothetical protein BH09MYX1_BH09MYX1_62500 [soil metagenome]
MHRFPAAEGAVHEEDHAGAPTLTSTATTVTGLIALDYRRISFGAENKLNIKIFNVYIDLFNVRMQNHEAMRPAPTTCPACDGPLHVARLACAKCETAVEGRFGMGRLGRLTRDEHAFVEVFLECRGKIKDVEMRLGISYPTVVARLEHVVAALGPHAVRPREEHVDDSADAILEALATGKLTPDEAAKRLRKKKEK